MRAEGKQGAGDEGGGGKYASRKFFAERWILLSCAVVVHIVGSLGRMSLEAKGWRWCRLAESTRKGPCSLPVLPVMVGTTVEWPNQDEIFHNVFSISEPKEFDLGATSIRTLSASPSTGSGGSTLSVRFIKR
ncbi:MAG: hypothetical protein U1G07_02755 [Verrucomicrobiota bacterium]